MNNNLAPIIVFVYNRLDHTRKTIKALNNNLLANKSELIIFSDGPKNEKVAYTVNGVRKYLKTIGGFKTIKIVEREHNWGLAKNIIEGVTEIVSKYGKIIVLEDDIVTSPYFLTYMNDALDKYKLNEKVMHVSGYMFPVKNNDLPETIFYRSPSCWGWGTWERAWIYYKKDLDWVFTNYNRKDIRAFNLDRAYDFWAQVKQNKTGEINTWAIFWYAAVFKRNGLCLHPSVSMIQNIGHDNSGINCGETNEYQIILNQNKINDFTNDYQENLIVLSRMKQYYKSKKNKLILRALNKMGRTLIEYFSIKNDA